jgi:hypothetical protein
MGTRLQLGKIGVDVVRKNIKNVYLSVHPPTGRVRIAAPERMSLDTVRVFAIAKLPWIKSQQQKLREQERESPREFLDRESHFVWGKRYLLKIIEVNESPSIELSHSRIILRVRPGTDVVKRGAMMESWYREQLRMVVPSLIEKWQRLMGVKVERHFIRRMKTKWGSCNHRMKSIRLNTDLARKPRECLEYVLVHEMTHLLEHTHTTNASWRTWIGSCRNGSFGARC